MVGRPVIVVGGGGHARVVIEALRCAGATIVGVVDPQAAVARGLPGGIAYLGGEEALRDWAPARVRLANGIGAVGRPTARMTAFERLAAAGYQFATVVHPSAVVATDVGLGPGAQIMAGAVLQPGCVIGAGAIVNTRAAIDHDCVIGRHCHVAPGAVLSGAVRVGDRSFVGAGATVIQGIEIGSDVVVAAGTTVFKNIPDEVIVRNILEMKMITVR